MACPFVIHENAAIFQTIWTARRGTWIQFQRFRPVGADTGVLGDVVNILHMMTLAATFTRSPDHPDALARPVDFEWILDDAGSGNDDDIDYWWPVPPRDYVTLGVAFSNDKPSTDHYWCVHKDYCSESFNAQPVWGDQDQGWKHHNGNLLIPREALGSPAPPNQRVPQTFLSEEGMGKGYGKAMVLTWPD